jgi:8-oxo-dGTP pyrophosphatase MutT (NUDIX family)
MSVEFEFSAGGVVTDRHGRLVLVAVRNFAGDRKIALPKGIVEKGESSLVAATREVQEETGFQVAPRSEKAASIIEYWYVRPSDKVRVKKKVSFFRFDVTGGDPSDHDAVEVDEVLVVPVDEGLAMLSYESERTAATEALAT